MMVRYDKSSQAAGCDAVAAMDGDLKKIVATYGHPPLWVRPNTFATLVLTILEQQVSLQSAYAAYKKLHEVLHPLTPEAFLRLTDEDLRACYFSRQKISYVRGLAAALVSTELNLEALNNEPDDVVRSTLKSLKGIGDWTVDIYLIHALRRTDVFPTGDLALVNALKSLKQLPETTTREELLLYAEPWRPNRTFATLLLWHYYIKTRGITLLH